MRYLNTTGQIDHNTIFSNIADDIRYFCLSLIFCVLFNGAQNIQFQTQNKCFFLYEKNMSIPELEKSECMLAFFGTKFGLLLLFLLLFLLFCYNLINCSQLPKKNHQQKNILAARHALKLHSSLLLLQFLSKCCCMSMAWLHLVFNICEIIYSS